MTGTLKDYLRDNAKFFSPAPLPIGNQRYFITIHEIDVAALRPEWKPLMARRDATMVDSLIKAMEDYLGEFSVPEDTDEYFQPKLDRYGTRPSWSENRSKDQASRMVSNGVLDALHFLMESVKHPLTVHQHRCKDIFTEIVDFVLSASEDNKVLVQVESSEIFNKIAEDLQTSAAQIEWNSGGTIANRVLSRACINLASHEARWLGLTSHDAWIFFRFHDSPANPCITYSRVERQQDNTRPLRALLGMVLSAELGLHVESSVNLETAVEFTSDGEEPSGHIQEADDTNESRQDGVSTPELPVRCSTVSIRRMTKEEKWIVCNAVDGNDECTPLGYTSAPFRLQRTIGSGSTGYVLEGLIDFDGSGVNTASHIYAMKTVSKGTSRKEKRRHKKLLSEFNFYRLLERARRDGDIGDIVPSCYGLFESKSLAALVLDYAGEALEELADLSIEEKNELFDIFCKLHELGIMHGSVWPRNIVRDADGKVRVIDFTSSGMHKCTGIGESVKRTKDGRKYEECGELRELQWVLFPPKPAKEANEG